MTPRARRAAIAAAVAVSVIVLALGAVLVARAPSASPAPGVPSASAPLALGSAPPGSVAPSAPAASAPALTPAPPVVPGPPASCGPFDPACHRLPISGAGQVAFTPEVSCGTLGPCTLYLDVYFPRQAGPWPVVVALPGGPAAPGIRHGLADFASLLAGQGAVVFVADYREGAQYGGLFPLPYEDIGCAIRFARAHGAQYGGAGSQVTLVAHSFGGFFAATEALSSDPFTPPAGACLTARGSTKPDAFVGIAGIYAEGEITPGFLAAFFGTSGGGAGGGPAGGSGVPAAGASGAPGATATAWAAGDPFALVRARSNPGLLVRLVEGSLDTNVRPGEAQAFAEALQAAGYNATLTLVPDADHQSVLQNAVTIRTVLETALGLGR